MVLNYIWIAFFFIAFIIAVVKLAVFGDVEVFPNIMNATFDAAKNAFEISIGLTGMLAFWLGMMKIGERGGLINAIAKVLSPVLTKLFPDIPKNHPAFGHMFMNMSANMLGLDNAATPLGLKAMESLQELNTQKDTATNPMIMFLVMNTSGLVIIPAGILAFRAAAGAAQPTDVFIPILLATFIATLIGIIVTGLFQRINLLNRTLLLTLGGSMAAIAAIVYGCMQMDKDTMNIVSTCVANVLLFMIVIGLLWSGVRRRLNVYDAFVEGAKEGFQTAIRIIPYLVAILVSIAVFRASGAMDWIVDGVKVGIQALGLPTTWVDALPTAIMKPLSGSGARGLMVEAMSPDHFGPDSFVGRLCCILQGSTDTTFYILAVYFGSVGITRTRHAVTCGLIADVSGSIAAILIGYLFFG